MFFFFLFQLLNGLHMLFSLMFLKINTFWFGDFAKVGFRWIAWEKKSSKPFFSFSQIINATHDFKEYNLHVTSGDRHLGWTGSAPILAREEDF